jgi:cytochrome c oxidase cbb3-type subunit III
MSTELRIAAIGAMVALMVAWLACDQGTMDLAPRRAVLAAAPESAPPTKVPIGPVPGSPESTLSENPYAIDRVAIAEGQRLFNHFNCAGCHGDHGGGGMGPSLRDEVWLYGGDAARVAASISDGRAHGMPAWGVTLTTEQILKMTAYIKSLRTPLEPQPPS